MWLYYTSTHGHEVEGSSRDRLTSSGSITGHSCWHRSIVLRAIPIIIISIFFLPKLITYTLSIYFHSLRSYPLIWYCFIDRLEWTTDMCKYLGTVLIKIPGCPWWPINIPNHNNMESRRILMALIYNKSQSDRYTQHMPNHRRRRSSQSLMRVPLSIPHTRSQSSWCVGHGLILCDGW